MTSMSEAKQGTNLTQAREEISALEGVIAVSEPYENSFFGYIIAVQILPECSPTVASHIPSQLQGIPVKINPALQLIENTGSGSCEKDSPIEIIAVEKQEQTGLVHDHRL